MKYCVFKPLAKFYYKNKHYQMFSNDINKIAFLEIDQDNKYHYPELDNLLELASLISNSCESGIKPIINEKKQPLKYRFLPKFVRANAIFALSLSLLGNPLNVNAADKPYQTTEENSVEENTSYIGRADYINVTSNNSNEEVKDNSSSNNSYIGRADYIGSTSNNTNNGNSTNSSSNSSYIGRAEGIQTNNYDNEYDKFLSLLAVADDEYDYKWANDYKYIPMAKLMKVRDSKAYSQVFDFDTPTLSDLTSVIRNNKDIPKKYKDFYIEFITDWLAKYPNSDFSVLYHNLKTIKIIEATEDEIKWGAVSINAIAFYNPNQNVIYVNKDIDLTNKDSDDYIITAHEFTHPARTARFQENGTTYIIGFYEDSLMGSYADEALLTNFVYEVQGLNNKAKFYTLSASYYRIILDCLGNNYTGDDYINHSVNYLIEQMNNYMGDEAYAHYIVSLIDTQMALHYSEYINTSYDDDNFQDLFDYLTRMYMKKYLHAGMSYSQAEEVFDNFMSEITFNFENLDNPYEEITEDKFRPAFEECVSNLGISKSAKLK